GAVPERAQPLLLTAEQGVDTLDAHSIERAAAAVHEFARRHAPGAVVADDLADADGDARLRLHAEHVLGDVGLDERARAVLVLGLHDVVGDHGDGHPRIADAVR